MSSDTTLNIPKLFSVAYILVRHLLAIIFHYIWNNLTADKITFQFVKSFFWSPYPLPDSSYASWLELHHYFMALSVTAKGERGKSG